jgi:hypothetical protein
MDGQVAVTTRVFLVDIESNSANAGNCALHGGVFNSATDACLVHEQTGMQHTDDARDHVNFDYRSTYLFKYDAEDTAAGTPNHAEQVVFALILDDTEAPLFEANCHSSDKAFHTAITVEAASTWELCDLRATDNVNHDSTDPYGYPAVVHDTTYQIEYLSRDLANDHNEAGLGDESKNGKCLYDESDSQWVTRAGSAPPTGPQDYSTAKNWFMNIGENHVGKYLVTFTTSDNANIYGHNAANNIRSVQQAILVRDTVEPTIYLYGKSPEYTECVQGQGVDANDPTGPTYDTHQADDRWGPYLFTESWCQDRLDTEQLDRYLVVTTTIESESNAPGNCSTSKFVENTAGPHTGGAVHDGVNLNDWVHGMQVLNTLTVDEQKAGRKETPVSYTCHDTSGNLAATVQRTVVTVDTNAPTLILKHKGVPITATNGDYADTHVVLYINTEETQTDDADSLEWLCDADVDPNTFDPTAPPAGCQGDHSVANTLEASDSCDTGIDASKVSTSWGPRAFNSQQLGDYVRTYTVSDNANNVKTKTRTYTVIDRAVPVITMLNCAGAQQVDCTEEATRDSEFTDTGATCHDFVDGELSHAVEVSGEVVNMRIPGTYEITYNCQDLSGNSAAQQTRKVVVVDREDPTISLIGASLNYVEAGFPYIDAGATATDTLDGDITQYIWTSGDTIDHLVGARSCEEVKSKTPADNLQGGKLKTGVYNLRVGSGENASAVVCLDSGSAVESLFFASSSCEAHGMVRRTTFPDIVKNYCNGLDSPARSNNNCGDGEQSQVCKVPAHNSQSGTEGDQAPTMQQTTGVFLISYHVEDKAGNTAADEKRTVVVKDTLPPVITLKLKDKLIHTSNGNQVGISHHLIGGEFHADAGTQLNPAGLSRTAYQNQAGVIPQYYKDHNFGNHNLMAESTTVNGWVLGAVVSAVAGVALLGFSQQKTATSVPV